MTSSDDSMNASSTSSEVNSAMCLTVSDASALYAGAISNIRSRPDAMRFCLYSCGLWARYADLSKYLIGNNVAPPSAPAATILGVVTSTNPSPMR